MSLSKEKLIASFRKFKLSPNNNEYYIAIIRSLGTDTFRLVLVDKEACYISKESSYDDIRNESYSTTNMKQFRNVLVSAISKPNDKDYEIQEIEHWGKDKNKTESHPKCKELVIIRRAIGGLKIIIANIKVYLGKKGNKGNNLDYLLEKMSKTLIAKQQKNEGLLRDNLKFQDKYNQSLQYIEESISAKNNQEQELLSKFVLILNEKKKKIRALQREILRLKQHGNIVSNNKNNEKTSVIVHEIDEEVKEIKTSNDNNNSANNDEDIVIHDIDDQNKNDKNKKNKDIERKKEIERLDTNDLIAQINNAQNSNSNNNHNKNKNKNSESEMDFDLSISGLDIVDDDDNMNSMSPSLTRSKAKNKRKG